MLKKAEQKEPEYLEVWREFLIQARVMRLAMLGLGFGCLVMSCAALSLARRPVYVVRVDEGGTSRLVTNFNDGSVPTHLEAKAVATEFIGQYAMFDSKHAEDRIERALSMMSSRLLREHQETYKGHDFINHVRGLGIVTEMEIESAHVTQETEEGFEVEVLGRARSQREGSGGIEEHRFESHVELRKMARTKLNPSGLIVDGFKHKVTNLQGKSLGEKSS